MKTALVHDWLIYPGGAEKVLDAIHQLFPSPIFTLFLDAEKFQFPNEIHTSFVQKFPLIKKLYRYYLPFFPLAIEQFDLQQYDLILSSSHLVAKGVITHPHQLHICYCHTPVRYAWDLQADYLAELSKWKKRAARAILHYYRSWDYMTASRVDAYIANSNFVAKRIKKVYNREAAVIYPPVDTTKICFSEKKEDFYITLSRLVCYKKVAMIVEAFSHLPDKQLIVIGDGPEMKKIKAKCAKNVHLLGEVKEREAKDYLSRAKAFIFAAIEDFGIAPVEAQAAGTPVIAFGQGGVCETVIDNVTGLFFKRQTVSSLVEKILEFEQKSFDPVIIRKNALRFNKERFDREYRDFVLAKWQEFRCVH